MSPAWLAEPHIEYTNIVNKIPPISLMNKDMMITDSMLDRAKNFTTYFTWQKNKCDIGVAYSRTDTR